MDNMVKAILKQLRLEKIQDIQRSKIYAANNFESVYNTIDPRRSILKTSIFRYIQAIARNESFDTLEKTKEAIIFTSEELYDVRTDEDYRKILLYLQREYPT